MPVEMADTFACAYDVFERELERAGLEPEPKHITTLVFAVDKNAYFEFIADDIIVHFSDDSHVIFRNTTTH